MFDNKYNLHLNTAIIFFKLRSYINNYYILGNKIINIKYEIIFFLLKTEKRTENKKSFINYFQD